MSCLLSSAHAAESNPPAVLLAGCEGATCGYEVATRLSNAGFALNADHEPLGDSPLTLERLRKYNAVVLFGLGYANADMSLGKAQKTVDALNRYLEAGGGVLVMGFFGQVATSKPPQDAFLKPLGLTPLFDEQATDPKTATAATSWKIPFALANEVADSPLTRDVKSLWYPVCGNRVGGQSHTIPFAADSSWQIIVRGSSQSRTNKGPLLAGDPKDKGTYQGRLPLVAARQVGKGRIVYLGITPEYFFGTFADTTLEGIVLDRGLNGSPSQGYNLVLNSLRWLAEPSLKDGQLGGAAMDKSLLANPNKVRTQAPYVWPEKPAFPEIEPGLPGVVGPRTTYSTGKASADQWAEKAKVAGLKWIVFLEDFAHLSEADFKKLKADCARLSSPTFTAIPGFTIDDAAGNHYFYFGSSFPYPDHKFLTADGKAFRSWNEEINPKHPDVPGQLAMTTLAYAYSISTFKLTAGNYLFSKGSAPFADFFSDYCAMGVVTARNGQLVEDASADFLKLNASGQGPMPLVIDLMDDPSYLGKSRWRTILSLPPRGGYIVGGPLKPETMVRDYFDIWHFYPDDPAKLHITSGPRIETWAFAGPRDYEGSCRGDFVWQNYRWLLRGKVSSAVGLKEVAVYDGTRLFRRFLPRGKKEFEFQLDLTHERQHELVLIATEPTGGRAISGEQWDSNHRLREFMCSDRNNQLTYSYLVNKDGIGMLLGGNQSLGTTYKRISCGISPSGAFKNDKLLGAPAFDGAAGGEPEVWEAGVVPISPVHPVPEPVVTEARRLLHTADVMIGDGPREHRFADNVPVYNVWSTLWRTEPVKEYSINRRNHYFQMNPDSPLAVFLWEIEISLKDDLPNHGFHVAQLQPRQASTWAFKSQDEALRSGDWTKPPSRNSKPLDVRFGPGSYAAFMDSPLGSAVIFPLTEGLLATFDPAYRNNVDIRLAADASPQKKGEKRTARLVIVGIPRRCIVTQDWPATLETVQRFYCEFALDGGKGGYTLNLDHGTVVSQRHVLAVDGQSSDGLSGKITGNLVSSLPITVSHLKDRWLAYLYDRDGKKARPIGVFEGKAWATVNISGQADLFVGHPVLVDSPELFLQVTQSGGNAWTIEVHNPTDAAIPTSIRANPAFDPLRNAVLPAGPVTIPAGGSMIFAF